MITSYVHNTCKHKTEQGRQRGVMTTKGTRKIDERKGKKNGIANGVFN